MVARQNVDSLEQLAQYLNEGVDNRNRALREAKGDRAAELRGEIFAFRKVLQILDVQFNVK